MSPTEIRKTGVTHLHAILSDNLRTTQISALLIRLLVFTVVIVVVVVAASVARHLGKT